LLHVAGDVAAQSSSHFAARCTFAAALAAATVIAGDASVLSSGGPAGSEIVATGFDVPSGIAVEPDGAVLVTDRRAGTLTRITPSGERRVVLDNLSSPRGVAVAADGVYVIEDGTRVLRLDPVSGVVSLVSGALTRARAIAAGPDGRIWIAARRGPGIDDEILRLDRSGSLTRQPSGLLRIRALAVDRTGIYAVADSLAGEVIARSVLARFRWRPDGMPAGNEPLVRFDRRTNGVATDAAGDVFVAASWPLQLLSAGGLIVKRRTGGELGLLASGLARLGAAAFGPGRELYVVEGRAPARLLRFLPPAPPVLSVPAFTNATPLRVTGRAQAGSLVQVMTPAGGVLAAGRSDAASSFALSVPLASNAETQFAVVATANAGNGLVGRPAAGAVVHDDHLPRVELQDPVADSYVNGPLAVRASAADDDSGMETLRLMLDGGEVNVQAAARGETLSASVVIDSASLPEGLHTAGAVAADRAGNRSEVARLVVVDRTPPDTFILNALPGTAGHAAAIAFGGSDTFSPDIEFSWRLDRAPWSPFSPAASVQLGDLAAGSHQFEVVARDRAGNVDPTPAIHTFVVTGLGVRILEPLPEAVIAAQTVWVRGTVDGGPDAAVSVILPEILQRQLGLESLAATHEAGTFAVEMPIAAGMTALTVVARDGGREVWETVSILVAAPFAAGPRLEVSPSAGVAPLTVRFFATGIPPGSAYSLDLESDGDPDEEGSGLPRGQYVYTWPGVYVATLTTTAPDGRVQVARGSIEVYDRVQLETRLNSALSGFKAAMRGADLTTAASFVHRDRRAAWAEYFARLTPAQRAATETLFTDLALVDVAPGRAECEMMRDQDGLRYSFPISFALDADGGWKLWQF
jgi:sugar lactone lactonase YvrE